MRWVAEDLCPFELIGDRGFKCLMKTGRPEYYLPHPSTVSHDVRLVFVQTSRRVAKILQVRSLILGINIVINDCNKAYQGKLNFSVDAWTSESSHLPFVAILVHFEHNGVPIALVLDVVKVAVVRSSYRFSYQMLK